MVLHLNRVVRGGLLGKVEDDKRKGGRQRQAGGRNVGIAKYCL